MMGFSRCAGTVKEEHIRAGPRNKILPALSTPLNQKSSLGFVIWNLKVVPSSSNSAHEMICWCNTWLSRKNPVGICPARTVRGTGWPGSSPCWGRVRYRAVAQWERMSRSKQQVQRLLYLHYIQSEHFFPDQIWSGPLDRMSSPHM